MKLNIQTRSGKVLLKDLEVKGSTVDDLSKAIHKAKSIHPDRQRLKFGETVLEKGQLLSKYSVKDGDKIVFKDLGPQVAWRTVFLIECKLKK